MSISPVIWGPSNALNLTNGETFTAATSGTLTLNLPSSVTTYTVTLPNAQGGSTTTLINDGAGNLSWGNASAFITLGSFGSSPNANAASLSGSTLTLQPASGSFPGGVSTTTQTFAGNKTFTGNVTVNSSQTASIATLLNVTGTLTSGAPSAFLQSIVAQNIFNATNTNSVSVAADIYSSPFVTSNTGTISTLAGFYFDGGGGAQGVGGTVTNSYGLYVAQPSASFGGNRYGAYIAGNVGLGTTSPSFPLDVSGTTRINNAGGDSVLIINRNASTNFGRIFYETNGTLNFTEGMRGSQTSWSVFDEVNTVQALTIVAGGNVGLGTATANAHLSIVNNVYTAPLGSSYGQYQILLFDSGSASTSYGMGVEAANIGFNSNGGFKFYQSGGSTPIATIGGNSTLTTTLNGNLVVKESSTAASIQSTYTGGQGPGNWLQLIQDNGAGMSSGNNLAQIQFYGARDSSHTLQNAAAIVTAATQNWSGSATGSNMTFYVTPNNTTSAINPFILQQDGKVQAQYILQTVGLASSWPQPQKNFLPNPNFENSTQDTNSGLITTTISGVSPTGAPTLGSATSLTLSVSSSSPISGSYSWSAVAAPNWVLGTGIYMKVSIDTEWQSQVLEISCAYKYVSGIATFPGTSSGTFAAWIYDQTNSAWIQPAGVWNFVQSGGVGQFSGTFQVPSNCTSALFCIICINSPGAVLTMQFDDFRMGPIPTVIAPAMSDWNTAQLLWQPTGSWTTNCAYEGGWKQVGDEVLFNVSISMTGAPGGSTSLTINLPSGYTIDTTKLPVIGASYIPLFSDGGAIDNSSFAYKLFATYNSTTSVAIRYISNGSTSSTFPVQFGSPITWGNNCRIDIQFRVPIVGLSSNTISSASTDSRLVACTAYCSSSGTISNNSPTTVFYNTIITDTHGALNTGSSIYTIPVSGYYYIAASVDFAANAGTRTVYIYVNGSQTRIIAFEPSPSGSVVTNCVGSTGYFFNAGDLLLIRAIQTSGVSLTYGAGGSAGCWFSIARQSGPALVQATSTVACFVTGTPTGTLNSSFNAITFPTITRDTTGSYNAGTWTCPVSGTYAIHAQAQISGTYASTNVCNIAIYINGSSALLNNYTAPASIGYILPVVTTQAYPLNAGDTVQVRIQVTATSPTFTASTGVNYFSITRVGN